MPAKKERLVKKLQQEGHSQSSAWAIATAKLGEIGKHGNPRTSKPESKQSRKKGKY